MKDSGKLGVRILLWMHVYKLAAYLLWSDFLFAKKGNWTMGSKIYISMILYFT